jgi:hypothetical protein
MAEKVAARVEGSEEMVETVVRAEESVAVTEVVVPSSSRSRFDRTGWLCIEFRLSKTQVRNLRTAK